jgi:hypothetical protein
VVIDPAGGDKAEAEQKLLDRMLVERPEAFGPDRLWVMDRNSPGVPRTGPTWPGCPAAGSP